MVLQPHFIQKCFCTKLPPTRHVAGIHFDKRTCMHPCTTSKWLERHQSSQQEGYWSTDSFLWLSSPGPH